MGDIISTQLRKRRVEPDARVLTALDTADKVISLGLSRQAATHAVAAAVIPKMLYGSQYAMPSKSITSKLRSRILTAIWGCRVA